MGLPINFEMGEILKLFRTRAKLSKTEVAKLMGVTTATITNYEIGRTYPRHKTMLKFKKVFGQDFADAMELIENDDGHFEGFVKLEDINAENGSVQDIKEKLYPRLCMIERFLDERAAMRKKESQN